MGEIVVRFVFHLYTCLAEGIEPVTLRSSIFKESASTSVYLYSTRYPMSEIVIRFVCLTFIYLTGIGNQTSHSLRSSLFKESATRPVLPGSKGQKAALLETVTYLEQAQDITFQAYNVTSRWRGTMSHNTPTNIILNAPLRFKKTSYKSEGKSEKKSTQIISSCQ